MTYVYDFPSGSGAKFYINGDYVYPMSGGEPAYWIKGEYWYGRRIVTFTSIRHRARRNYLGWAWCRVAASHHHGPLKNTLLASSWAMLMGRRSLMFISRSAHPPINPSWPQTAG